LINISAERKEFKKIMHAIALAESSGNPNAVGDQGVSIGLYQNNMATGRGVGHTKENLMNPEYNAELAAKDLINYYRQGIIAGLSGSELTAFVSRYGQRPAAGNEYHAAAKYGQYIPIEGIPKTQQNRPQATTLGISTNVPYRTPISRPENIVQRAMSMITPKIYAAEAVGVSPVGTLSRPSATPSFSRIFRPPQLTPQPVATRSFAPVADRIPTPPRFPSLPSMPRLPTLPSLPSFQQIQRAIQTSPVIQTIQQQLKPILEIPKFLSTLGIRF